MIEVSHLSKRYGSFEAVKDISFTVGRGEIVGFLGPNGAGKSTTLRILAGYLGATSGVVQLNGFNVATDSLDARASIGYMPETSPLYPEMNVREYLHFRAELKRVPRAKRAGAVAQAMQDAGLGGVEATLIGQLSKGYRQRVGLADALVASPPLLILDEPTAGLDPNQIREVRTLIGRLRERHTVLLSTHILSEVEATCTRGIVIARGELVASGTLSELHALRRARRVRLRVRGEGSDAAGKLVSKVKGVSGVDALAPTPEGHARYVASFEDPDRGDDITESIVRALTEARIGVLEVTPQSSLEEVFSELTSTTAEAE